MKLNINIVVKIIYFQGKIKDIYILPYKKRKGTIAKLQLQR